MRNKRLRFRRTGTFVMTGQIEINKDLSPEEQKKILDAEWSQFLPTNMEYSDEEWEFEDS